MRIITKVTLTKDKVKLVVEDRDATHGWLQKRQQMTFRRRHFEQALQNAEISVPWTKVSP